MYIFYWNIKYYPSFFMSMNCFQNTIIEYQKKKVDPGEVHSQNALCTSDTRKAALMYLSLCICKMLCFFPV